MFKSENSSLELRSSVRNFVLLFKNWRKFRFDKRDDVRKYSVQILSDLKSSLLDLIYNSFFFYRSRYITKESFRVGVTPMIHNEVSLFLIISLICLKTKIFNQTFETRTNQTFFIHAENGTLFIDFISYLNFESFESRKRKEKKNMNS